MAHCDTKTEKIYGCKPKSRVWYHEIGHIKFAKSEKGSRLHNAQNSLLHFFFVSLLISILWKPLVILPSLFLLIYFLIDLYEEKKCWEYADAIFNSKGNNEQN